MARRLTVNAVTRIAAFAALVCAAPPLTADGAVRPVFRPDDGRNSYKASTKIVVGNGYDWRKPFVIGAPARVPGMSLRDDGMTLVHGKPFFPIGIYDVKPLAANLWNYDRALADLKAARLNSVHSYVSPRGDAFLAACEKYG